MDGSSLETSALRVPECLSQESLIKLKAYGEQNNFSLYGETVLGFLVTFLKKKWVKILSKMGLLYYPVGEESRIGR